MKYLMLYFLLTIGLKVNGDNRFRMLVTNGKDSIQFNIEDVRFEVDSNNIVFIEILDSIKANSLSEIVFNDNLYFDTISSNCFGGIIEIYYLSQKQFCFCLMDYYSSNMPIYDYSLTLSDRLISRGGILLKPGQRSLKGFDNGTIWRNGFREYLEETGKLILSH